MQKNISLTELEKKIQQVLLAVSSSVSFSNPKVAAPQLRIAGGWVRDKLLGLESNDIDIAIDNMSGEPFAQHVKKYMLSNGFKMSHVSKISLNPEKSKHLETATARIFDLDVDFVNLRSETYQEDSRNPVVEFGSPAEDALRRDITINALFFNLHTDKVEDHTGKGLYDLENGIIRTPLPPLQTFLDDPLRVLRVIRFASRFNYRLCEDIVEASKDLSLRSAFDRKISRERVGVELEKMMKGPNPYRAIHLLEEFGFYDLVFEAPAEIERNSGNAKSASRLCKLLNRILLSPNLSKLLWQTEPISIESVALLYLSAALSPFSGLTFKLKNKDQTVVKHIVMNSLKLSLFQSEFCDRLLGSATSISKAVEKNSESPLDRKTLGVFVRELGARPLAAQWNLSCLMAFVLDYSVLPDDSLDAASTKLLVKKYEMLMECIFAASLQNSYDLKTILDGKTVAKILDMKPGPQLGQILQRLLEWQLGSVDPTEQEAIQFLKLHFAAK